MRILANTNIDFLKWRWVAIAASAIVIGAGLLTVIARGSLPLGIDFTGGTAIVLRFNQEIPEDNLRQALAGLPGDKVVQRMYGSPAGTFDYQIRLPLTVQEESGTSLDAPGAQAVQLLKSANVGEFEIIGSEVVGPTIGKDLQRKGIYATLTALAGILVYIGFRFNFVFAAGAIVAVFHDILITLAMLTWFGYDLSLNVVAAILTITGYSVNDTIVIFDRVRENQRMMRRESLAKIVNTSVNQTLSRTVLTAGTTFLSVFALFLFGGEVLRAFAFTMLVGIVVGTYSTVFIAAAIAIILQGGERSMAAQSVAQSQADAQSARRSAKRARG
ncbi:MAG TPA: protein translocase subunit SecF [Vicinamibacterales bacterium]|nr:protein translocase subunit SecF [Vicinamibacterales bacterium]